MPFRDSILEISPPFLAEEGGTAEAIQVTIGEGLDAIGDWMREGVYASMPGIGTNDGLQYVGRDMLIERGPNETDDHYIERLRGAVDSHRIRGNAGELLRQLHAWFSPSTLNPIRAVSDRALWHEIDPTTEVVTRTLVGTNWTWDVYTGVRRWRGWVIIDSSAGPWTIDRWGDPGNWGDGGTWGSDMTTSEWSQIRGIIDRWRPGHIVARVIVSFDAGLFLRTDTSPPNPNGDGEDSSYRAPIDAMFSGAIL